MLADLSVSGNIINETTSYYPMKNEAYMLFATNDKLYRYNLRELENNVAPGNSNVFVELSKWGYSAEAKHLYECFKNRAGNTFRCFALWG